MNTTASPRAWTGTAGAVMEAVTNAPATYQALAACAILLLLSRVFALGSTKTKGFQKFPFWVPLEIALTSHFVFTGGIMGRILSLFRRNSGSFYGFTSHHQVLYDFKDVDRLMTKQARNMTAFNAGWTLMLRVFGFETGRPAAEVDAAGEAIAQAFQNGLYRYIEKVFVGEQGSTESIERADIPGKAADLVTLGDRGREVVERKPWERNADVRVVTPGVAAEANLHSLIRDLGACVLIPLLHGQEVLDRNPTFLADFWKFDNDVFPLRIIGLPLWFPLGSFQEGLAARERCNLALEDRYRRVDRWMKGEPSDDGTPIEEPSYIVKERQKIFVKHGVPLWARGRLDFSLLWGQNGNSQALVFWFVAYIYSTPDLLPELRSEVAQCVKVDTTSNPPRIASFDLHALMRDCPLLKSAMYETFRMTVAGTSLRWVHEDMTVEEQGEGGGARRKHHIRGGSWLSAPHGVRQYDPALYPDPQRFVPDRFLVTDAETGRRVARWGSLNVWGAGAGICKGRTLAEKEIMSIAAAVMTLWDMEPATGRWKVPGMRPGTGVMCPTEDLRVVLRRRVFT